MRDIDYIDIMTDAGVRYRFKVYRVKVSKRSHAIEADSEKDPDITLPNGE